MTTTGMGRWLVVIALVPSCFDPTQVENASSTTSGSSGDSTGTTGATTAPTSTSTTASSSPTSDQSDDASGPGSADDSSTGADAGESMGATDESTTGQVEACVVDGTISGVEACDDDNQVAGDGCSECMIEDGYACTGEPSVCGIACDPLLQDCGDGDGCYALDAGWFCVDDASDGAGTQDVPCGFINICAPGLACIEGTRLPGCSDDYCCSVLCDLTAPSCPTGLECIAWYGPDMAPPGYEHVGVCATQ